MALPWFNRPLLADHRGNVRLQVLAPSRVREARNVDDRAAVIVDSRSLRSPVMQTAMQRRIIYSAITLAVILADAGPSIAAGAMAVGLPSDVRELMSSHKELAYLLLQDPDLADAR